MAERTYIVDGDPVDFQGLIELAREEGYAPRGDILLTSEAAEVLRANGHIVTEAKDGK